MKLRFLTIMLGALTLFASCGEDEGTTLSLEERIKGTWIRTTFETDCADNDLDELVELTCDGDNCIKIILGDSTYVTINTVNGVESRIPEFYIFEEANSRLEICDGLGFTRNCNRSFTVTSSGNKLTFTRPSDEDSCTDIIEFIRDTEDDS